MASAQRPDAEAGRRRTMIGGVAVAALVVALIVGAAFWFVGGDAPAAVDITSAVDQVAGDAASELGTGDTTTNAPDEATAEAATASAADGDTWVVDTSVGEFSITDSTGTFIGVRVDEELSNVGATTAVIRTPEVDGTIAVDGTTLTAADIEADFQALVSDRSRRDDAIQRTLNTGEHPTATFTLTEPVELDALPTVDDPVTAAAVGELTINGVTNTVDVPLDVALADDVAVVTGTFDITFADYGVEAPTAPIVLSVADTGTVELQLFLTPRA